jgi:hypothetical protein
MNRWGGLLRWAVQVLLPLPIIVLAADGAVQAMRGSPAQGPVYRVAVVQVGLARHPDAWMGRPLWVRGVAHACGFPAEFDGCPPAALVDAAAQASGRPLWLAPGDASPLRTLLRHIPVLARVAPAPQVLHWGEVATYRVRLQAIAGSLCGTNCASRRPCWMPRHRTMPWR